MKDTLSKARAARQASTNETKAQRTSDASRERDVTGSSGSKSGYKQNSIPKQREESSKAGSHSGRPIPDATPAGGDDNGGAYNGGTVNAQSAMPSRPPMPIAQSSDGE